MHLVAHATQRAGVSPTLIEHRVFCFGNNGFVVWGLGFVFAPPLRAPVAGVAPLLSALLFGSFGIV